MEAFRQCVALGPVAIYLLVLGAIGLLRRPVVVSGGRDAAALALAVSGLVFVGPLALFFPESIAARMGPMGTRYVWLLLISLIVLCLVYMLLNLRPRLVIYNITADQLRPILEGIVERLDLEARWAGDSIFLPGLGVQLHLDGLGWMRNISLVSSGPKQDYRGWTRLAKEIARCAAERQLAVEHRRPASAQRRQRAGRLAGDNDHPRSAGDCQGGSRVVGLEIAELCYAWESSMSSYNQLPLNTDNDGPSVFGPILTASTIAAAGVLYLVTRHPLLAAILPWLHGGWPTFSTGLWLLRTDPVRRCAWVCLIFYLAAGCWKAAVTALGTMMVLACVGRGADSSRPRRKSWPPSSHF